MTSLVGQLSVWNECISQFDTTSHIFITGIRGSGKTTLVRELLQHYAKDKKRKNYHLWGYESVDECILLGPEQDRGIQTIRGHISLFIRQMSLGENIHRWVIIDDVDTLPHISQQALRRPMESYSHITRFILIGTSEDDLIPALRSRCIHITMNTIDPFIHKLSILKNVSMPAPENITDEMWGWMINIAGNNMSDLIRLLYLIRDIHITLHEEITLNMVCTLCSAPLYLDFIPLLLAISQKDTLTAIQHSLLIWKKGYAYEDILESFQTINTLFGNNNIEDNVTIHKFLISAWIAYCKGNTSILTLQHVIYKILEDDE
jgi:DNA polymerase III delta prime subunit